MPNGPLDAICAKYELKRSALAAIQRALQQAEEGAAAAAGGPGGGGGGKHTHGSRSTGSGGSLVAIVRKSSARMGSGSGAVTARAIGQVAAVAAAVTTGSGSSDPMAYGGGGFEQGP